MPSEPMPSDSPETGTDDATSEQIRGPQISRELVCGLVMFAVVAMFLGFAGASELDWLFPKVLSYALAALAVILVARGLLGFGEKVYQRISGPKEFWVVENDFHVPLNTPNLGGLDIYPFLADWLRDALGGRFQAGHTKEVLIRQDGVGPYEEQVAGYWLPERAAQLGG